MRVLAATHKSQGRRPTDFDYCVEGELVWIPESCDLDVTGSRRCDCGCASAFAGLASGSATTTVTVIELDLSRVEYVEMVGDGLELYGWPRDWAESDVDELLSLAEQWDIGDVVERSALAIGRRFTP